MKVDISLRLTHILDVGKQLFFMKCHVIFGRFAR